MAEFLEVMSSVFTFLFAQLSAFSTFLTETVLGQIILAGLVISLLAFLITVIFSFTSKK